MNGGTMKRSRARLAAFASLLLAAFVPATMARADSPVPLNNTNCSNYAIFTFDDGPDPVNTPYILNTLPGLNINAWFFVIGSHVAANPQLVQAEAQAGDLVENHSWDHPSFTGASTGTGHLSQSQIDSEINQTQQAVTNAGVPAPTLYRPPYGDIDAWTDTVIRNDTGLQIVMPWQSTSTNTGGTIVDSKDWTGISAAQIDTNVINGLSSAQPGKPVILSFHDGDGNAPTTAAALQPIVNWMNANNWCSTIQPRPDMTGGVVPLPPLPWPAASSNLVTNPTLAQLRQPGNPEPVCYQIGGANQQSHIATWSLVHPGYDSNNAVQVKVTNWTAGDAKLVLTQRQSEAACLAQVTPGHTYTLWVRYSGTWSGYGAGTDQTKGSIAVYYRNSSGAWSYWAGSPIYPPSNGWNVASWTTPPLPSGATAISFGFAIQGNGTVTTTDYAEVQN